MKYKDFSLKNGYNYYVSNIRNTLKITMFTQRKHRYFFYRIVTILKQ